MKPMHLNLEVSFFHTEGHWRFPGTFDRSNYFTKDPGRWVEMAKIAERGKLDLLFWGEGYGIPNTYEGSIRSAVEWGVQWPRHDQSVLFPIIAHETEHIGMVMTVSTTFYHPFHVAKYTASMDHVVGGRLGLNVINSGRQSDFANFGYEDLPDHGDRYARMTEFLDVCKALWGSVEPDALVLDVESGRFCDPDKVRPIDHRGRFFDCKGPLSVLPTPQGRPLLLQAGQSPDGLEFAVRNVDLQYAAYGDDVTAGARMRRHRDRLDQLCAEVGRDPDDMKVVFNAYPVIGDTVDEAKALHGAMKACITDEAALCYLSHNTTFDYSVLPERFRLSEVVERIEAGGGSRGGPIHALAARYGDDELFTIDFLVEEAKAMIVPDGMVGTPGYVADRLEQLHEEGGGNGFTINMRPSMIDSVASFVDGVVPILQERGLFRRDYGDDETLRDRYAA